MLLYRFGIFFFQAIVPSKRYPKRYPKLIMGLALSANPLISLMGRRRVELRLSSD